MKRSRKINRRMMSGIALLIGILFSAGVLAQNSLKNYDFRMVSKSIYAHSDQLVKSISFSFSGHETAEAYAEEFVEENIELENWMINLDEWADNLAFSSDEEGEFIEEELQLEDWMMQDWSENQGYDQIESWMISPLSWDAAK